jgi:hypothetical protein
MIHNWKPLAIMEKNLLVAIAESVFPMHRHGNDDIDVDRSASKLSAEVSGEHDI